MSIAIVIPTIRPERYKEFVDNWKDLIDKHKATLVTVWDGDDPYVKIDKEKWGVEEIMGQYGDLIFNHNDGVRNLGFAFVAKYLYWTDTIITLDDDVKPIGDTIQDHLNALEIKTTPGWMLTADRFTRGIPYGIRNTSEVVLSHGVWEGVADWDAPSQLISGNPPTKFFVGKIPSGVLYPMCGMNVAFKKKALPYMYWAPMGPKVGIDRFADIWCGIESKKEIDSHGWSVVTGMATVRHDRASNVWKNLQKEALGLEMNENYGKGDYFKLYAKKRKEWKEYIEYNL